MKLAAGINEQSVVTFLEEALKDDVFRVRRAAALSLKLLTGEDYFESIYRSELGRTLSGGFWCLNDVVNDASRKQYNEENRQTLKQFAEFFKKLNTKWTYSDIPEKYFTPRRKKHPDTGGDGRLLYKNFNFSLDKILGVGKTYIYLLQKISEVITSPDVETEEKRDVLQCLRLSIGSHLRNMEEAFHGFLAVFPYLRTEFNLVLPQRFSQRLPGNDIEMSTDEKRLSETFLKGFIDFRELHTGENLFSEEIVFHLVTLQKRLVEFFSLCQRFRENSGLNPEAYYLVKRMGLTIHFASIHNLNLLSYWAKDE